MRKQEINSKISGIAVICAMLAVLLLGSPSIVDSAGDLDVLDTVNVTGQEQKNCDCDISKNIGFQNPAAEYCTKMGYEYKTVKTEAGERGICVLPDGDEVNAWAFYRGECAAAFSYCAKMGWPVAAEPQGNGYSNKCCTCILPDGSHKTVSELLDLGMGGTITNYALMDRGSGEITIAAMEGELPESFDWRNKDGQDWVTPVKDQGACGSCWAFAAVGTVEGQYNIFTQDPTLDLDLSEQYLVSDCCACGDCDGGDTDCALRFVRDEGIPDEGCLRYTQTDCACDERCPDWYDRLYTIDATGYVSADIATIREYLINKGPLSAYMGMGSEFGGYFDEDGIYRCAYDNYTNHAVVIVGYDEAEDCWIIKNSFGTDWGDDGYFKVGCRECSIENWVRYAALDHTEEIVYKGGRIDDSGSGDGDGNAEPGESITMPVTLWNRSANTTFTDVCANLTIAPILDSTILFFEDFEGSWPENWAVGDWNSSNVEDYWEQSDYRACSDSFNSYSNDVSDVFGQCCDSHTDASLVTDVNLSGYTSGVLSYEYRINGQSGYDHIHVGYFDGSWQWVQSHAGGNSGWTSAMIEVPAHAKQVGFRLSSDSGATKEGAYIDNVILTGYSDTSDPYISISDDSEEYGDITAGNWATSPDDYNFVIDPACPAGHVVTFNLNITANNGGPWIQSFTRVIVVPPDVSNVSAALRSDGSGTVDISYDVSASGPVDVAVDYWDVLTGWYSCKEIAGDAGPGIEVGRGKAVIWDARTQLPRANIAGCKVRVMATGGGAQDSAGSNAFTLDTDPPEIIYEGPSGSTVSTDSSIIIAFNEPMDHSSAQSAFFISPAVVGSCDWSDNRMTFDPTANLADGTLYTVTVSGSARDLVGNALDGNKNGIPEGSPIDDYAWTFKTMTGSCFIATAAYGTPMAEEVQILRDFRDEYMLPNPLGQVLVDFYYSVSPPLAEFMNVYSSLRPVVRTGLTPLVLVSTVVVNSTLNEKTATLSLLVLVVAAVAMWVSGRQTRTGGVDST